MLEFRVVYVYVEKNGELLLVPTGIGMHFGTVTELKQLVKLPVPYGADGLWKLYQKAFNLCNTEVPDEKEKKIIQEYKNKETYFAATAGLKLFIISWTNQNGYVLKPMKRRNEYEYLDEQNIELPQNVSKEAFKDAVQKVIEGSIC